MRTLTAAEYALFVAEKPCAAIHFHADWDVGGRPIVRAEMIEAEESLHSNVNFAEVDCDSNAELARTIPVKNVPLVAYYRHGILIAALIGANQNVRARVECLLRGESFGYGNE